jgi:hypothetical protein
MGIVSSVICLFGGNVAALESQFDISCQGPWVASESEGGTALCQLRRLAGHVGFEPANPSASYLIGFA